MGHVRALAIAVAVSAGLGVALIVLVVTGSGRGGEGSSAGEARAAVPQPSTDRFDSAAAWRLLKRQVALGPRPAGSVASRALARRLRRELPRGRYQRVPGGLRNVIGVVPGRSRRYVVVGAHYDTKDLPGFVGANDAASGTAVAVELARALRPRRLRRTVVFILFDGEEAPRGVPDSEFERRGLRGSKVAARRYRGAEAMILLDFVGDRRLRVLREGNSDPELWRKLRRAAKRVGVGRTFPAAEYPPVSDDHVPFLRRGVPSIDLIDFDFPCFHRTCDDLTAVSERSLDAVGETMLQLLPTL